MQAGYITKHELLKSSLSLWLLP